MTELTEKDLAEKLAGIYGDINDYDWAAVARKAAEVLGVDLAPEPKPLPTEPGDVILATEVRGVEGGWRMMLDCDGVWFSPAGINGDWYHQPEHITAWTPARVVPEGELISLEDVRKGDRVRVELENDEKVEFTVDNVTNYHIYSEYITLLPQDIRTIHLLHREEA